MKAKCLQIEFIKMYSRPGEVSVEDGGWSARWAAVEEEQNDEQQTNQSEDWKRDSWLVTFIDERIWGEQFIGHQERSNGDFVSNEKALFKQWNWFGTSLTF